MHLVGKATVTNDLLEDMELLFSAPGPVDQAKVAALFASAETLAKVDAAKASLVKSGLYALQWNAERCFYFVRNALRLDGSSVMHSNCALNLKMCNLFREAADVALAGVRRSPNDLDVVKRAFEMLTSLGEMSAAVTLAHEAARMGLKDEDLVEGVKQMSSVLRYLNAQGIPEERLQFELGCVHRLLTENKIRVGRIFLALDEGPVDPELVVGVRFEGDFAQELEFETELGEALGSTPGWDPAKLRVEVHYEAENALYA